MASVGEIIIKLDPEMVKAITERMDAQDKRIEELESRLATAERWMRDED